MDQDPRGPASGAFRAVGTDRLPHLYFPLAHESGLLSWTSPRLHGAPTASHHEYLAPPLTAEDLPHTLIHRDFWLAERGREPFSLSGLSPKGLLSSFTSASSARRSWVDAAPGWFRLTRRDAAGRFTVWASLWCPVDLDAKVELMWVGVENTSSATLRFSPYAAIPLFARSADHVRDHRHVTALLHRVEALRFGVTVCPTMSFDERGHTINRTRYAVVGCGPRGLAPLGVWAIEEQFLGTGGSFAAPAAVWERRDAPPLPQAAAAGREAIGGFRFAECALAPGARAHYLLAYGITTDRRDIGRWVRWIQQPRTAERSLAATREAWQRAIHRVSFFMPDRRLDHWLAWVNTQPLLRRLYGNSYLPQFDYGRGGRGWRDLWQDSLALLLFDPAAVRPTLLRHLGGVRIDGSNATIIGKDSAFIADRNNIPRTWMDHGCWPAFTVLLYIDQTGDVNLLREERGYFRDGQLFRCRRHDPGWRGSDGFALRTRGGRSYKGSVLEHLLVQNVTAFFNVGAHNVCRLEGADWNDGLDMAARRGESVAFSAFYAWNLKRLAQAAERLAARGVATVRLAAELAMLLDRLPGQARVAYRSAAAKRRRLDRYLAAVARGVSGRRLRVRTDALARDLMEKHDDLAGRIRRQEWLTARGASFFNGYYDDRGRRVEGAAAGGMRMTLTGQVFPLMSGIAAEEQVDRTVRAVNRFLRHPRSGGIRLNTDFGGLQPALGRAFSFAYGDKENGAVFSHMAVMYASSLYARRRAAQGRRVWSSLYQLAMDQPAAKIFPGLPEYFNAEGRGMYCYLTGSASWLIYVLLTQAYGIRGELGDLIIDPQLTPEDFGARLETAVGCRFAGRRLRVSFVNRHRLGPGAYAVARVLREGRPLPVVPRPHGGVHLARAVVARWPARAVSNLQVILEPIR